MDYKDYYTVLGIARGAAADEIQRAYRKLARKFHPDINKSDKAENRFKEINEAYEVLKDPDKKAKYDKFGSAWKQAQRTGAPPSGFEDVFSQFGFGGGRGQRVEFDFGGAGGGGGEGFSSFFDMLFGSGGARGRAPRPRPGRTPGRGADHEARITLPLEEAGKGGHREIKLTDPVSGRKKTLRVTIPKGIRPGQKIRLAGQGGAAAGGGPRGNLFLTVDLLPHPTLTLHDTGLHTYLRLAPWEAALGGPAQVRTLDGEVTVKIPAGSSSGRKIRLRGKGFPDKNGTRGDLIAEIRIVVPETLSEADRKLYEQLAEESDFEARG